MNAQQQQGEDEGMRAVGTLANIPDGHTVGT